MNPPERVFLDTNVYIFGVADADSPEWTILQWAGYGQDERGPAEIVVSDELFTQILRVAKRIRGKDWGGQLLGRIWRDMRLRYVLLDEEKYRMLEESGEIPREDVGVYLTARAGQAQYFVSSNRELVSILAAKTGEFECLTADEFVQKYIGENP